ncbi:uncharacterized protein PGTG_21805 [Puccinia graminis f. sp. tritici CRL 75-36-700-3]|uniref:Uncharacterized protein n=1 Tax=Puccinia graminis f. sp. tritici (strain CRL 75-36-700-3 / race SCCL) TaxID=418459 RepID=H6QSJ1_PUCGT|nr:uncharacterized protein PGTG_21805 [Puccinia graminis f. sp. tritici CRL 75-36-700-3]EHS63729.1 hypothetical protein PGTG_21805 [Puccinia graminis f. sp. tritici CRL 75-36-700-3]
MEQVQRWEGIDSFHKREKIAKLEGARGSILNELPYWQSAEHCGIEVMHNLLLGNRKDHSFNILKTYQAGNDLKKRVELETKWKKKDIQKIYLAYQELKKIQLDLQHTTTDSGEIFAPGLTISLDSKSSNPTVRRYELHRRSPISTSSLGSIYQFEDEPEEPHQTDEVPETEDLEREGITVEMEEGPTDEPQMKKEELRALQNVISQTKIPTWVSRVPHNFGMAGAGSLKAADWLILYTVYYPLAIVPYWVIGDNKQKENITGSKTVTHQDVLRDSLIKLIEIKNILMKHQLNESDITNYSKLIVEYQQTLQTGWPKQDTKANLHLSQHYPVVIKRLGPPIATAAWPQERLNGMLGKIPNNHHMAEIHRTLTNTWNKKSRYYGLENQLNVSAENLCNEDGSKKVQNTMPKTNKKITLDPKVYKQWRRQISQIYPEHEDHGKLGKHLVNIKSVDLFNCKYVAAKDFHLPSPGNSNVEVSHGGDRFFGCISLLFGACYDDNFCGASFSCAYVLIKCLFLMQAWDQNTLSGE